MGNNTNKYYNEEKNLTESYYDLLNKNINKDMIEIDRFIKDFQKCYINQRIVVTKLAKDFIPWKFYLLRAINNLSNVNGCLWAQDLYYYISNESLPE